MGTGEGYDQRQQAIQERRSKCEIIHRMPEPLAERRSIEDFGNIVPLFLVEVRFIKKLLQIWLVCSRNAKGKFRSTPKSDLVGDD
jgi:hypothetical protein